MWDTPVVITSNFDSKTLFEWNGIWLKLLLFYDLMGCMGSGFVSLCLLPAVEKHLLHWSFFSSSPFL